jgi:hypothetical protein
MSQFTVQVKITKFMNMAEILWEAEKITNLNSSDRKKMLYIFIIFHTIIVKYQRFADN